VPQYGAPEPDPTVVTAMWRGLDLLRPIAWLYAVYSAFVRQGEMARPWLAWVVLAVLGAWTVAMVLYRSRHTKVVAIELFVACAAILSTRLVDTHDVIVGGAKTLPGFWPAAAVVAWAIFRGWRAGMLAALLVSAADVLEVGAANERTMSNIVILVLLGGCIGYCADLSRDGHAALSEAERVRAEVRERDRLARTVHDGVLQTLAYIHRRGLDIGGESHELASMAAEQELLLRALVSDVPTLHTGIVAGGRPEGRNSAGAYPEGGEVDLRLLLGRFADSAVNIIPPAEPVLTTRAVANELQAAVAAALDNVRRHAGDGAQAWVLIEDHGRDVTVTVRDDGVGVLAGRLAEAAGSGRIGVAKSIMGRMSDLGGAATIDSRPGAGTRLELSVCKQGGRP
jgi:signal transduction histidine kinase